MSDAIAIASCQFIPESPVTDGSFSIISGLSLHTKIQGQQVCLNGLQVQVSGTTNTNYQPGTQVAPAPVSVTINASKILKSKIEGKNPLTVGDSGVVTISYNHTVAGSPTVVSVPVTIKISTAGQVLVKGE